MPVEELEATQVEAIESQEPVEQVEPQGEPQETDLIEVGGEKRDGRHVPGYIKAMKETNREAYKDAIARYWRDVDTQKLTEGFDVKGTRAWLEEKGGREALEQTYAEMQSKSEELDGLLSAVQGGDGSIAARLIETAGENATPIATAVLNEWAKSHPDDYRAALGGVIDGTLAASPLPMGFERVGMYMDMLADVFNANPQLLENKQAVNLYNRVQGELKPMREFLTSFRQQPGQAQPTQNAPRGTNKVDQRAQDLDRRENEIFQTDLRRDVDSFRNGEIMKHLKTLAGFKPDAQEDIEDAIRAVTRDVNDQMGADKNYQQQLNNLQAKRDKDGMLRLIRSREAKAIEQIAPKWGRKLFGQPAPKPAPVAPRQSAPQPTPMSRMTPNMTRSQILRQALAE